MVLGIIAEYNPFTNGHLYHLIESKRKTGCEYSIAVISGNFTQRGSTSIVNKWEKTQMAILNGIDLVVELPTMYATSSAENFAEGSIKILNSLGIVDFLAFGTENENIDTLKAIAKILLNEPSEYKRNLLEELKKGKSFPKARENAILEYFEIKDEYKNILSKPNNILGIEYLKALEKYNSKITPISIKRFMSEHNRIEINGKGISDLELKNIEISKIDLIQDLIEIRKSLNLNIDSIASSTTIRELIKKQDFEKIKKMIPADSFKVIEKNLENGYVVQNLSNFQKEILYELQMMSVDEIAEISDVNEGLEFLIKNSLNKSSNFEEFFNFLKSKRYTYTRVQRILLHVLLKITKQDIEMSKKTVPYIRVLGFNENGKILISKIKEKNPNLEIITSVKHFENNNKNINLKTMLEKDILATNVYTLGYKNNFQNNLDYTMPLIKVL